MIILEREQTMSKVNKPINNNNYAKKQLKKLKAVASVR